MLPTKRLLAKFLVLLLCQATYDLTAASWRPTERLLQAIRYVESANGLFTYGDDGNSLGDFQLSEAAWLDVTSWRKSRNLPTYGYEKHVWNKKISRAYAADYLSMLHGELKRRLDRPPTASEVYAAYNMGLSSFAQCEYKLARVNPTTAKKCQLIRKLMRGQ